MSAETLLELQGLTRRFGPITAVDNISFKVARGEILGFLGPNGAGKSTTMKMITGFLPPSAGTAIVAGHDIRKNPIAAQRAIGYLPEGAPLYGEMTPAALLAFVAQIRGLKGAEAKSRCEGVAARLQLDSVYRRPIETLSKGFKRRVGLAQAILMDPEILILDEPTDGLDPNQKHDVRKLLAEMAGDKVIVISTHILEEVEALCSRAIVIGNGKILCDKSPEDLQALSVYHHAVSLVLEAPAMERLEPAIAAVPGIRRLERQDIAPGIVKVSALPVDGARLLEPLHGIVDGEEGVREIFQERGRLDDVFRSLTTDPGTEPPAGVGLQEGSPS